MGTLVENQDRVNPKCQVCIRVYIEKIGSEYEKIGQSIGSILYANSFITIDETNSINLTESVPNLLNWHTN